MLLAIRGMYEPWRVSSVLTAGFGPHPPLRGTLSHFAGEGFPGPSPVSHSLFLSAHPVRNENPARRMTLTEESDHGRPTWSAARPTRVHL